MAEKKYSFRKLTSKDLFLTIKLVKKIGLDNLTRYIDSSKLSEMMTNEEDTMKVGLDVSLALAQGLLDGVSDIQDELFNLLEATSNLSKKEIEEMDLDEFVEMLYDFVRMESFKKVFQKVVSLLHAE